MPISVTRLLGFLCITHTIAGAASAPGPLEQVQHAERQRIDVMAGAAPSVVCTFEPYRQGGGAGVIITEDGYGLTNFHVIMNMLETRRGLGGLSDGKLYPLLVLGIDPTGDVTMFRLTGKDQFTPADLGDSDTVQLGDWVFAMGNPFGLAEDYTPTVTHGIVSGLHRYQFGAGPSQLVYTDCIQVDASINPGNSGGPLFDMAGRVVGINGRASFEKEQRGRVNVGVGFAISINQIKRFMPHLRTGLLTEHGSLGATVIDAGYGRVVFEKMLEPSVASAAGIRVGDRLTAFAGQPIHGANQFANLLGTYPADWPVSIEFERASEQLRRRIRLERLPVHLKEPFEPNEEINREETARVLFQARQALGQLPIGGTLTGRGVRITTGEENARQKRTQKFEVTEKLDGSATCRHLDDQGRPIKTYEYTGRSATLVLPNNETVSADRRDADRLNLWLAAQRAVYQPTTDESIARWTHRGGDALGPRVAELLEYRSPDSPDLLIAFDPITHLPARIRWKPIDAPSTERPAVELDLTDYRPVDGTMLPHEAKVYVGGMLNWTETLSDFRLEDQP